MSARDRRLPWWRFGCKGCGAPLDWPPGVTASEHCADCDREMECFRARCEHVANESFFLGMPDRRARVTIRGPRMRSLMFPVTEGMGA